MTGSVLPAHGGGHEHAERSAFLELGTALPLLAVAAVALAYVVLAWRRTWEDADGGRGWSPWRTASFVTGCVLLGVALVPGSSPWPTGSFAEHMVQHLLIGMYAPLLLVLGAPATLLLRSLPRRWGRVLGRLLGSRALGVLAHPVTALVLNLGGLAVLHLTPLYAATTTNPLLHHLVHVHFFAAGYLFAYAIAGPDPAPHRPSVPSRLVVLGVAVAGHAVLAQLLYAGAFVQVPTTEADRRAGADLMYYAGDIAELLLALAMVSTWRPERRAGRARAGAVSRLLRAGA